MSCRSSSVRALGSLLLAALGGTTAMAADVGVMPVAVQLSRDQDRATVQVQNHGTEPVTLQADAVSWTRLPGALDDDAPTDALIVNPPVFTVQPGRTQVLRVGLRKSAEAEKEATFRMVLREVPNAASAQAAAVSGSVRVLMALRVPVYVAPREVKRDQRWEVKHDAHGRLTAQVSNTGNVHLKVGGLKLRDGSAIPLAEQDAAAVLFPGESRSFVLATRTAVPRDPMTLEVVTDRGLQHVPVQLAAR